RSLRAGRTAPQRPPGLRLRAGLRSARRGDARMIVASTIGELDLPRHGVIALVPTMGALHEGHTALFRAARAECDVLVASLFVNNAQFNDAADLAAYPRDFDRDAAIAEAEGVHVVFAPAATEIYPPDFA